MKAIEAYYGSWCYPPRFEGPSYCRVAIKYVDDTWEEIFKMDLTEEEGSVDASKSDVARAILEHYLECPADDGMISRLVHMKGVTLCRLTPKDLSVFKQMDMLSLF